MTTNNDTRACDPTELPFRKPPASVIISGVVLTVFLVILVVPRFSAADPSAKELIWPLLLSGIAIGIVQHTCVNTRRLLRILARFTARSEGWRLKEDSGARELDDDFLPWQRTLATALLVISIPAFFVAGLDSRILLSVAGSAALSDALRTAALIITAPQLALVLSGFAWDFGRWCVRSVMHTSSQR